jgi:hypothetical protein
MKLAVVGSREFHNYEALKSILDPFRDKIDMIVSGGARGADTVAQRYAKENGLSILIHYPDYKKYGRKKAPAMRNLKIADDAERMIAIPFKRSVGTWHAIRAMQKLGKPVQVIDLEVEDDGISERYK